MAEALSTKPPQRAMSNVPWMDAIDDRIRTGEFSRYDKSRGVGSPEKDYLQCNQFTDRMAQDYWGVKLPRMKHQTHQEVAGMDPITGKIGKAEDWPENPMGASDINAYMKQRTKLTGSGVHPVSASEASKLANRGELVFVGGPGHSTIAAPSKDPWPLVYRSDLAWREDSRSRVGLKNKGKGMVFYRIKPDEYNNFNKQLESAGFTDRDVYDEYNSEGYKYLHSTIGKKRR